MSKKALSIAAATLFALGVGAPAASAQHTATPKPAPNPVGQILGDGPKGGIETPPSIGSLDTEQSKPVIDAITTTNTSDPMNELDCITTHFDQMNTDAKTWGYTGCEVDDEGNWTFTWQSLAPEFTFLEPFIVYADA